MLEINNVRNQTADASILSVLELVREALPTGLVDAEGYARLAAIAERLPEALTTFWGFECRLGEAATRADILFETKKESRGLALIAGAAPSPLDDLSREWQTWQILREFAKRWRDASSSLSGGIRNLWLEFDAAGTASLEETRALIRQPSVFIGPEAKTLSHGELFQLILDAAAIFGQSDGWQKGLEALIAALPEGAEIFQVGFMLARKSPGLRVCVNKIPAQDIPTRLCQAGWKGDAAALACLLEPVAARSKIISLNLNVTGDGPAEKIGVECYMDWLVDDVAQWAPLFSWLEERGLCLTQKRRGLEAFPGLTRTPRQPNPNDASVMCLNLYRKIHHIKLSIAGGRAVEAKGYIALSRPALYLDAHLAEYRDAWYLE